MPRTTAGARYPFASTAARQHDHRWCPVVDAIAARAAAGGEPWGAEHDMPPLDGAEQATRIRQGLFRGRGCARLRKQHGQLSVSVTYRDDRGELHNRAVPRAGKYVLVVRVWTRGAAKQEIARRVADGQPLDYNVMRS